ncbi:MAG TPA: PAS domain S-box protein, partial [Coleofasciculaceae cyanobacterium]
MSQIHELDTFYSDAEGQPLEPGTPVWKIKSSGMEHCKPDYATDFFDQYEQRFFKVFQESSRFISLLKPDGTVLEANRTVLAFSGLADAEAIGQPLWQLLRESASPADLDHLQQAVAQASSGQTTGCDMKLVETNSTLRITTLTIALSLQPIYNDANVVTWLLVEGHKLQMGNNPANCEAVIPSRTAASLQPLDLELQASERLFGTLAELAPVGIFRTELSGRCVYVNQRWREISGLLSEEVLNDRWIQALHPDDRDRVVWELQEAMSAEQVFYTECRFLHPDGKVVWVIGQALPERLKSGELVGYIGTIT